jgi:hypothetical protein
MVRKKNEPQPEPTPSQEPEEEFELEEMPGNVVLKRKKSNRGRPVYKWNPQYVEIAKAMLRKGATSFELADAFGITERHLRRWRAQYPDLDECFKELRPEFDAEIERRLAERALGYYYPVVKPMIVKGQVVMVEYEEYALPSEGAAKHWLALRQPDKWRPKEQIEVTGDEVFKEVWQTLKAKQQQSET